MLGYVVALVTVVVCVAYVCFLTIRMRRKEAKLIRIIPDMVLILDPSLKVCKIYNAGQSFFTFDPVRMIGKNLRDFFTEQQIGPFEEGIRSVCEAGGTLELEYCHEKDNKKGYFEVRYSKIDEGQVACVIREITGRKMMDMAVRQNQELLDAVLDNIPFPVMLKDVQDNFRYLYWNKECDKQSGFLREDILGKTDIDLYGEERGGRYQRIDRQVVESGQLYKSHEKFVTPDGTLHDTIVVKNVIGNDVCRWMLVVRWDVTEFMNIQNALKDANQLNRLILNNSDAGFIFINPDFVVEWENVNNCLPASVKIAYTTGKCCYQSVRGLDHPCEDCIMLKAIKSGKTERQELYSFEDVVVEILANPVWENGKLRGTVLRLEDITRKKEVEKELRQAKEDAEKSDRLKSAFLANISHEIRTPLNAIVGFSSLICHTEDKKEYEKYVQIIYRNNELLLQLISDILDISKIESGTLEYIYSEVDLDLFFHRLEDIVRQRVECPEEVKIVIRKEEPGGMIYTEENRLLQVLLNLIRNAVKFTSAGEITIGYEKRQEEFYFYVADTGTGIPPEKQEIIFDRFVKLDSFKNGTGLGLFICKTIISKLKGKIGVISAPGKGATFWFTLPLSADK